MGSISRSSPSFRWDKADVWDLVPPERNSLLRLKQLALRKRAWFAVLDWKQRRLIDVVISTVDRVSDFLLLRVLAPLVRRLLMAVGGDAEKGALALMGVGAYRMMEGVAVKIVQVAQRWGNRSACEWLREGFLKCLLIMNLPQNNNTSMLEV